MKKSLNYSLVLIIMIAVLSFFSCKEKGQSHENNIEKKVVIASGSDQNANRQMITKNSWKFAYDLSKPMKCTLPKELVEVSALSIDARHNLVYAVNDEKALLFALENCDIISKSDFGKNGDYEGVELVGNEAYILKSNGKLIKYDIINAKVLDEIKTPLKLDNDAEGLGYDPDKNELLIACKGSPNISRHHKYRKSKAVYAYDIDNDNFIEEPLFIINDDDIASYLSEKENAVLSKKEKKNRKRRALKFSPAAIAKNKIDNNYYILSTVGKVLMIIDSDFNIIDIQYLDHPSFIQPEGICFNSEGDLLISNEGKSLEANILTFSRK